MENLAHSLTALAIAKAGVEKKVPFGAGTLLVAANLPDADIVVSFYGPLHYLHYHRGITHSLIGTLALGVLLGVVAWLLRRRSRLPDARLGSAVGSTLLVAATHPLLDFLNSYGLWPYLPFSDHRVFGDLVFIVDPYLWIILGSGVYLASSQGRIVRVVWILGMVATTGLVSLFSFAEPRAFWAAAGLATASTVLLALGKRRFGPRAPVLALLAMVGYWGFLAASHRLAWGTAVDALREYPQVPPGGELSVIPRPVDPLRWDAYYAIGGELITGTVAAFQKDGIRFERIPTNRSAPEVRAALQTCPGKVLTLFGRFEYYQVELDESGPVVVFRDARFTRRGDQNADVGFGTYRIRLDRSLEPRPDAIPCPEFGSVRFEPSSLETIVVPRPELYNREQ